MKKILLLFILLTSTLYAQPPIAQPNDLIVCDQNSDGTESFDLTSTIPEILNGLNPSLYVVTFYATLSDAQNEVNPFANLASYTNSSNPQTIYVRVFENANPTNFAITDFDLIVILSPAIVQPPDLIVYESPFDGTAVFDLTIQTPLLMNGAVNLIVTYYETLADAQNGVTQIVNPSTFQNIVANQQTVYARVESTESGCISITNFDVIVLFDDIVFIPDVNFKAKLLQADITNTIAKNNVGSNIKVDVNDDDEIQVSEALSVFRLNVYNSSIVSMEGIDSFPNLRQLECSQNLITEIDISTLLHLTNIGVTNNPIVSLDCNNNINLEYISVQSATLKYLFIKNGVNENTTMDSGSWWELFCCNPSLEYVCCDESQLGSVVAMINQFQLLNCEVNTYCFINPGGDYNTITGTIQYDFNNNGCDSSDSNAGYQGLDVSVDAVSTNSSVYSNGLGVYNLFTSNTGTYGLTPNLENPSYFSVTPSPAEVFIGEIDNTTTIQNFCISASGVHPDLEVVIAPVVPARPGFEAVYKIVYKNKGNQVMTQNYGVNFFYNHNLMSFVSSSVTPSAQGVGGLQWDYANLMPFESRSVLVTFLINAPTDTTNPVNIDDELTFTASISPQAGDSNVVDNLFVFDQTVVGSYDPNDITCMQGNLVAPSYIGQYLHYMIRFENTGTAPAENIVVKMEIDAAQYNLNSLQLLAASHNATVKKTGNKFEFIFENIQLDSGGHGNILLKVKSNGGLTEGSSVTESANIYFDYNFPVLTNDEQTVFATLSLNNPQIDQSVSVYPNPVKDIVTIHSEGIMQSIQLFDVQGRLLQTMMINANEYQFNLSERTNGVYFVKITTDNGVKIKKIVKE